MLRGRLSMIAFLRSLAPRKKRCSIERRSVKPAVTGGQRPAGRRGGARAGNALQDRSRTRRRPVDDHVQAAFVLRAHCFARDAHPRALDIGRAGRFPGKRAHGRRGGLLVPRSRVPGRICRGRGGMACAGDGKARVPWSGARASWLSRLVWQGARTLREAPAPGIRRHNRQHHTVAEMLVASARRMKLPAMWPISRACVAEPGGLLARSLARSLANLGRLPSLRLLGAPGPRQQRIAARGLGAMSTAAAGCPGLDEIRVPDLGAQNDDATLIGAQVTSPDFVTAFRDAWWRGPLASAHHSCCFGLNWTRKNSGRLRPQQ